MVYIVCFTFEIHSICIYIVILGGHYNSLQMIRSNRIDVAAIDSTVFHHYLKEYPERKDEFHIVCSLGPFPIQPIVVKPRLPGNVIKAIVFNPRLSGNVIKAIVVNPRLPGNVIKAIQSLVLNMYRVWY